MVVLANRNIYKQLTFLYQLVILTSNCKDRFTDTYRFPILPLHWSAWESENSEMQNNLRCWCFFVPWLMQKKKKSSFCNIWKWKRDTLWCAKTVASSPKGCLQVHPEGNREKVVRSINLNKCKYELWMRKVLWFERNCIPTNCWVKQLLIRHTQKQHIEKYQTQQWVFRRLFWFHRSSVCWHVFRFVIGIFMTLYSKRDVAFWQFEQVDA